VNKWLAKREFRAAVRAPDDGTNRGNAGRCSWSGDEPDPFYDAPFGGAWLRYDAVVGTEDPRSAALAFLRDARQRRMGY